MVLNRVVLFVKNRVLGHRKYIKFIVLTRGRSGSEWLISTINSHPNCHARGELFKYATGIRAKSLFNSQLKRKWARSVKAIGFKIFYHHPLKSDDTIIWDLIINDHSIKVIHLIRRNQLRSFISTKLSEKNQQWTLSDLSKRETQTVEINIKELFSYLKHAAHPEKNKRILLLEKTHEILQVYYEDLVNDFKNETDQILTFLSLPHVEINSDLVKQNPEKLPDTLENFIEIQNALKNTEYEDYLCEEMDI